MKRFKIVDRSIKTVNYNKENVEVPKKLLTCCKSTGYITEEFCEKHQVSYRLEVAEHTAVPIALGMVLANKLRDYGSDEWRERYNNFMLKIYLHDCKLYDNHKKDDEDWHVTRKQFYSSEGYPLIWAPKRKV